MKEEGVYGGGGDGEGEGGCGEVRSDAALLLAGC